MVDKKISRAVATGSNAMPRKRTIAVAPITRAVRVALAASAIAFVGSGTAVAGYCTPRDANNTMYCNGYFNGNVNYNVVNDLTLVVGDKTPTTVIPPQANRNGISASATGALDIISDANVTTKGGIGILARGGTSAGVTNTGDITNNAATGDAIGIYSTSPAGPASVDNSGNITVVSQQGLADGIFASGTLVDVDNSGTIDATGYTWAAGIEAQGSDTTTVTNSGSISAVATANVNATDDAEGIYGHAFGIYATGGDGGVSVTTTDTSTISASGVFATGISAESTGTGGVQITNAGDITVGDSADLTTYYGTGIHAVTSVEGSNVAVANSGDINVNGYFSGTGIEVLTTGAGASGSVSNSGNIVVDSAGYYGVGTGIVVSADGDASIDNSGSLTVSGYYGPNYGAAALAFNGDALVDNSGDIDVSNGYGVLSFSQNGAAAVTNSGSITVTGGLFGINAAGAAGTTVDNSGTVTASDGKYNFAIQATSTLGDVSVTNSGTINAGASDSDKYAFGVLARARQGDAMVANSGTITATGKYSYGIEAVADLGDVAVNNSGTIDASGNYAAFGVFGVALGGGDANVVNSGDITASSESGVSFGVYSRADAGNATASNSGSITATAYYDATGIRSQAALGDATLNNSGSITAISVYGNAFGLYGYAPAGTVSATNSGDITTLSLYGAAEGILAAGDTVKVVNRGSIGTISNDGQADGIFATGGNVTVNNGGSVAASGIESSGIGAVASYGDVLVYNYRGNVYAGGLYSYGIAATSDGGNVTITNTSGGNIEAYSSGALAVGAFGASTDGNVTITNAGTVTAHGDDALLAAGVYGFSENGNVSIVNHGTINTNTGGNSIGVLADLGGMGSLSVGNRGFISTTSSGSGDAIGIEGTSANGGKVLLRNHGTIMADAQSGEAIGIRGAVSGGKLTLDNTATGNISAFAVDGDATGLLAELTDSSLSLSNSGSIAVGSVNGNSYAIRVVSGGALASTISNSGSIQALSINGTGAALFGGNGADRIVNTGSILGAIVTNGGDDTMSNGIGGVWDVIGRTSDFGAGNDTFSNARGGTVNLANAGMTFGSGNNRFTNAGTIKVSGDSVIDMTGAGNALAKATASSFTNNGVIDFLDGAADDHLTITGGFGGKGDINLDVSLLNNANDKLFVTGSLANGTSQKLNVMLLDGLPKSTAAGTSLEMVHVSGGASPSAFVAGKVLGVSPRDFVNMGLSISSQPDAAAKASGGGYLLAVQPKVMGLNSVGVLASSAALGVDSLMSSTIGSYRDRQSMMAQAGKPLFTGLVPWVRNFNDEGGMNPDHVAGNFGQLTDARLNQDNRGTEVGLNLITRGGFSFGTNFSRSEGKQYVANGYGMDTIRGNTVGVYGTWVSPQGFYVDASWRRMQFETYIDSLGGRQQSDGVGRSADLQAGYTWKLGNGLNVEPQFQYTSTSIDGIQVAGDQAVFEGQDARWQRARLGLSLSKEFQSGTGWAWTPYGEVSALHTFNGVANYSINNDYFGNVMSNGTSALVKFGLGARKGGFQVNGGLNWIGGGAFDGGPGGQVMLNYAW